MRSQVHVVRATEARHEGQVVLERRTPKDHDREGQVVYPHLQRPEPTQLERLGEERDPLRAPVQRHRADIVQSQRRMGKAFVRHDATTVAAGPNHEESEKEHDQR